MQEPIKLELDTYEESELLTLKGKRYWHNAATGQFHEILSRNNKKHQIYIDADDRPGEMPPDGNGWLEWRRGFTAQAQAAPEEQAKQLRAQQEWNRAVADFDSSFLAQLSPSAYTSLITARILELRSRTTDTPLIRVQVAPSRWEALPNPTHRNFHLMTKTLSGWQDSVDGSIWHKEGSEWIPGPGEDIPEDEYWETL